MRTIDEWLKLRNRQHRDNGLVLSRNGLSPVRTLQVYTQNCKPDRNKAARCKAAEHDKREGSRAAGSTPDVSIFYKRRYGIHFFMILVLTFLVPDAIAGTLFEFNYFETEERIDAVSTCAIAGHTANRKTPRDKGSR